MATITSRRARSGGRPRKFSEPSSPVTVTLPDRTLQQLRRLDTDRGHAIVKAVDAAVGASVDGAFEAEVVEMAPGIGIIIVPPSLSLRAIPWLRTIEVAPTRHLLAIVPGTPIERIEVALLDLIDEARETNPEEVPMLLTLTDKIRQLRRGKKISQAEILFVDVLAVPG